jgi:hypothetical protein
MYTLSTFILSYLDFLHVLINCSSNLTPYCRCSVAESVGGDYIGLGTVMFILSVVCGLLPHREMNTVFLRVLFLWF